MPLLLELGWILEVIKLLGRFAPLADRLVSHAPKELPPPTIDALDAELQDQISILRNRFEAPMNDLRKQVQEQNLKLHQIQQDLHNLHAEVSNAQKLAQEIKHELATFRLLLLITLSTAGVSVILVLFLLLRH